MMLKEPGAGSKSAAGASPGSDMREFFSERPLLMKFMRFAVVGGGSVVIYAAVTWALVTASAFTPPTASVVGYLAAMPLNFLGQKIFAFRSGGGAGGQAVRYVITSAANIAVSYAIMWVSVNVLGIGVLGGIVLTILTIPSVTFFVFDGWVFRQ